MYGIYIFSIVVASMADVRNFDFSGGLGALGYLAFIVAVGTYLGYGIFRLLSLF